MTSYGFEHRFLLTTGHRLPIEAKEIKLAIGRPEGQVTLDVFNPSEPFNATSEFIMTGKGFLTKFSAINAGDMARSELIKTFVHLRIGAYFGGGGGSDTSASIAMALPYLVDIPRLYINDYGFKLQTPEESGDSSGVSGVNSLITLRSHITAVITPGFIRFNEALGDATRSQNISKSEEIAYDYFSIAPFAGLVEANFMMLMMALEALIDQRPRSILEREHIQLVIDRTLVLRESDNTQKGIWNSLLGGLEEMKQRESVRQAGKRLIAKLSDHQYSGVAPMKFFDECYVVRSRLVHGLVPVPTKEEIGQLNGPLADLVCDLIANQEISVETT